MTWRRRFPAVCLSLVLASCNDEPADRRVGGRSPGVVAATLDEAIVLLQAGSNRAARELLAPLAEDELHPPRARFLLGLAEHREGRYGAARQHFHAVAESPGEFPERLRLPYYLGWCLYNLGDIAGARRAFEEHLRNDDSDGDTWYGLGLVALDEGKLDEAERRFQRAFVLAGSSAESSRDAAKAYVRLADVALLRGELEAARDRLFEATRLRPRLYQAYYKLHLVLRSLGDEERAERALRQYEIWRSGDGTSDGGDDGDGDAIDPGAK